MSKQQLTELLIKGDKPFQSKQQSWFSRYNHVVDVYNSFHSSAQVLQKLHCPYRSYNFASLLINNYLFNIAMVLGFTFLPVFNVGLLFLVISYMLFLRKQTQKHQQNLIKVPDPFQSFYFYPQMCQQLSKHFTTLNLTVEQIQNFKFSQAHNKLRQTLVNSEIESSERKEDNQKTQKKKYVKVPIYDQYFYDSFFLVRKEYYKAISWSILGMTLLGLSGLFYYAIFQDFFTT